MPQVKTKIVTNQPTSPWYTPDVHESKKLKRKDERKWRTTRLAVHREIYITQRNNVSKLIEKKETGVLQ